MSSQKAIANVQEKNVLLCLHCMTSFVKIQINTFQKDRNLKIEVFHTLSKQPYLAESGFLFQKRQHTQRILYPPPPCVNGPYFFTFIQSKPVETSKAQLKHPKLVFYEEFPQKLWLWWMQLFTHTTLVTMDSAVLLAAHTELSGW